MTVDDLILKFEVDSREALEAALAELATVGEPIIPTVIELYRYGGQRFHSQCSELLGMLGPAAALPVLNVLLDGPQSLGFSTMFLLYDWKDPRTLEPLIQFLQRTQQADDRVISAINIINALKDQSVVPALIDLIENPSRPKAIKAQAVRALGALRAKSAADLIMRQLDDPDIKPYAALALYQIAYERGYSQLQYMLLSKSVSANLRSLAVHEIVRQKDRRFVPTLITLLTFLHKQKGYDGDVARLQGDIVEAFGKLGDERAIDTLMQEAVVHGDYGRAFRSLKEIGSSYALERLIRQLGRGFKWWDEYGEGRKALNESVAAFGETAIELLLNALKDKKFYGREDALKALSLIGEAHGTQTIIGTIETDKELKRNKDITTFLNSVHDRRSFDSIIESIRRTVSDGRNFADVLAKSGDVERILRLLDDKNEQVRTAAIYALWQLQDPRAVQPLIDVFPRETTQNQDWIRHALFALDDPRALDIMSDAQLNRHYGYSASDFLAKHGDSRTVDRLLAMLDQEPIPNEVFRVLGKLGDRRAVNPLRQLLQRVGDSRQRQALLETLLRLGDEEALQPYLNLLNEPNDTTSSYDLSFRRNRLEFMVKTLIEIDPPKMMERLVQIFLHPPEAVGNMWANNCLFYVSRLGRPGFEVLLLALKSPDPNIRYQAIGHLIPVYDLEQVIDSLIPMLGDEGKAEYNESVSNRAALKLEEIGTAKTLAALSSWRAAGNEISYPLKIKIPMLDSENPRLYWFN